MLLEFNFYAKILEKFELEVFEIEPIPFGASGPAIRVLIQTEKARGPIEDSVNLRLLE